MNQIDVETIRPMLRILSDQQITAIHQASLEILARYGVKVLDEKTRITMKKSGAFVYDNEWVKIPSHLIKRALATAPETIVLSNQKGERTIFWKRARPTLELVQIQHSLSI